MKPMAGIISIRLSYVKDSGKTCLSETIRTYTRSAMKESAMIRNFLATLRQRHALRQSIGSLLRRADDHLLEDIGLTRCEVQSLIAGSARALPISGNFAPFYA